MVEFAIVFPVVFLFFLVIIQIALLVTARQVVNYAAFCAARSAIVQIPEDTQKARAKAARAAAIACAPISPSLRQCSKGNNLTETDVDLAINCATQWIQGVQDELEIIYDQMEKNPLLAWYLLNSNISDSFEIDLLKRISNGSLLDLVSGMVEDAKVAGILKVAEEGFSYKEKPASSLHIRYIMSRVFTSVKFYDGSGRLVNQGENLSELFRPVDGSHKDITVEVQHYYSMRVPYVNKLFYFIHKFGGMKQKIEKDFAFLSNEYIPEEFQGKLIEEIRDPLIKSAEEAMDAIMRASDMPFYVLPIRARCTMTVEGDEKNEKRCCD